MSFFRQKKKRAEPPPPIPGNTWGQTDPTNNVLQLVRAEGRRQDDLREAESRRVDQQMELRAKHYAELREAEAKRIDAIRSYDVGQGVAASNRGDTAALTLATQVSNTAETLRNLVATTASAHATALSQITMPIIERLALLEKAQYEGSGKQAVTDPMMNTILVELKALRENDQTRKGSGIGMEKLVLLVIAIIMALVAIAPYFKQ